MRLLLFCTRLGRRVLEALLKLPTQHDDMDSILGPQGANITVGVTQEAFPKCSS